MKPSIDFLLNGERVSLADDDPTRTLLTWLRESRRLIGTKEGCAEGDCGACTVVLAERDASGALSYQPANSCILFLGALDGREVITVEGLKNGGALHPAQQAMVDCHGSQCGFCTPGFVMALYAHYKERRLELCDALAGNLCRCTGYRPILAAGERMEALRKDERTEEAARAARLAALPTEPTLVRANGKRFCAPTSVDEFAAYFSAHPGATILAGGTDLGLVVTKAHRDLDDVVYIGRIAELKTVRTGDHLQIGAAVSLADAYAHLAAVHPDIGELLRRFGGAQVRACGTLAGNIANGSPIGDSMPVLLALGAELELQRGAQRRLVPLAGFYTGYRKSVLEPGEFIRTVRVPRLKPGVRFAAYKLSKRFDQDISGVCAAFYVDGSEARFGFGGMAPTPARARKAEAAYARGIESACDALAQDFQPITDQRASSWYRLTAAQNLLRKFHAQVGPRALLELDA
ncbi:MAG TPA: xanthine dehydrogenase small subunit [Burkholderiales bacterium]|nr:xanthine dehydrogenase small subunit [Burkholderiales bacterium]